MALFPAAQSAVNQLECEVSNKSSRDMTVCIKIIFKLFSNTKKINKIKTLFLNDYQNNVLLTGDF